MTEYTQGICADGAAILRDGQPMTVDEIVAALNRAGRGCTRSHPHENMTPECELRTEVARLVNGLSIMAKQKTAAESRDEYGEESGDWEEGYDAMVRQARALLATHKQRKEPSDG